MTWEQLAAATLARQFPTHPDLCPGPDLGRGPVEGGGDGSADVAAALLSNPHRRVVVPFVAGVGDGAERRLDVVPSPFVLKAPPNELCDESASPPRPDPPVEVGDEVVVQRNV